MEFYLGTHQAHWLKLLDVPLFVSRHRLERYKTLPRAKGPWSLDSGGFTELSEKGYWSIDTKQYLAQVRRYRDEVGGLRWAAPMDWMCEPFILAKTGLTIAEHQRRTTENYLNLRMMDETLPIIPVLQGWQRDDYLRHAEDYYEHGVMLDRLPLMGVGTVCRRQATEEAVSIMRSLWEQGFATHGFGFKTVGLRQCWEYLASADSMAWSYAARRSVPLDGCTHNRCNNCMSYALRWRIRCLEGGTNYQLSMPMGSGR